jgi:hypothetical protein
MKRSYTSSPPSASMACRGTALPFMNIGLEGVDGIELALDRVKWRALMNTVMMIRVP